MAQDDYFVVAYKLLKLLYEALKQGQTLSKKELDVLSSTLNNEYWIYILSNLYKEGYISGVTPINTLTGSSIKITSLQITPKGIQYLHDNSTFQQVKEMLSKSPAWLELLAKFVKH